MLRGSQLRWHVQEKELFALVSFADQFGHLLPQLDNARTVIYTDNNNMYSLLQRGTRSGGKPQADRVERWRLFLSMYKWQVRFLSGTLNTWADLFTRGMANNRSAYARIVSLVASTSKPQDAVALMHSVSMLAADPVAVMAPVVVVPAQPAAPANAPALADVAPAPAEIDDAAPAPAAPAHAEEASPPYIPQPMPLHFTTEAYERGISLMNDTVLKPTLAVIATSQQAELDRLGKAETEAQIGKQLTQAQAPDDAPAAPAPYLVDVDGEPPTRSPRCCLTCS
jgi:hypothetical protein